jgi:hypothetical protein
MSSASPQPITLDPSRARTPARLVLVDAMELAWQRAKCRGQQHALLSADRGLVGLNTLQQWLWQRRSDAISEELWTTKSAELQEELRRVRVEMERHEGASQAYETAGLQILELAQSA